jgi:hypothetical protein
VDRASWRAGALWTSPAAGAGAFGGGLKPNEETWTVHSDDEARQHLAAKVRLKHRTGYDLLPPGRRIEVAPRP